MTKGTSVLMQRTKQAYRYGQLARRGMNIYALFTPLRDALRKTSLGDVRIGDLRMPFDVLYIGFEEGSGITFGTRTHPRALVVDGAYVTAAPVDPETGKQHIDVCITTRDALSALRAGYGAHWPFSYEPHFTFTLKGRPDDTFEAALGEALDTNAVDLDAFGGGAHTSGDGAGGRGQCRTPLAGVSFSPPAGRQGSKRTSVDLDSADHRECLERRTQHRAALQGQRHATDL